MKIARDLHELQNNLAGLGSVSFVPTMGALHDGHLSLLRAAKVTKRPIVVSIFVNPMQFGPREDFAAYPRDEAADLQALEAAGCDLVWLPTVEIMYPPYGATTLQVGGPALRWEGESRPGHFNGVATVVAKLFGQIHPKAAYFGEKDWQQIQVIKRFVQDLLMPVEIVAVPTARAPSGLALSSRNRFLTLDEAQKAPALYQTLIEAADQLRAGGQISAVLRWAESQLQAFRLQPDYVALVDAESLEPASTLRPPLRLLAAAKLGAIRLLDNIAVI